MTDILMLEYWKKILKKLPVIMAGCIIAAIAAFIISSFIPKSYKAKATIILQEQAQQNFNFSALFKMMPAADMFPMSPSQSSSTDYLVNILKSRTLTLQVIEMLKLKNDFKKISSIEDLTDLIQKMTTVKDIKTGLIEVTVISNNPKLSSDIANAYVEQLQKFIEKNMNLTEESEIVFLRKQLEKTRGKLESAENNLKDYRERNKTFSLSKDVIAAISTEAGLNANMILEENKLETLRAGMTEQHPEIGKIKRNIELLKSRLKEMPKQEIELARLIRDVKVQEIIYETLLGQYETSKINKSKTNDKFVILDKAFPPLKHFSPNKFKNIIFFTAGWIILSLLWIVFTEEFKKN